MSTQSVAAQDNKFIKQLVNINVSSHTRLNSMRLYQNYKYQCRFNNITSNTFDGIVFIFDEDKLISFKIHYAVSQALVGKITHQHNDSSFTSMYMHIAFLFSVSQDFNT